MEFTRLGEPQQRRNKSKAKLVATILLSIFLVGLVGFGCFEFGEYYANNVDKSLSTTNLLYQDDYYTSFEGYLAKYEKKYMTNEEHGYRFMVFSNNYRMIKEFNQQENRSFTLGINKFADLTKKEFEMLYLGYLPTEYDPSNIEAIDEVAIPRSIDWRENGAVTHVKDQGNCGSCWAFSATGAIEGAYAIKNKNLVEFSEQQLLDCSSEYENMGCSGGWMTKAFEYVKDHGLQTEEEYPYYANDADDHQCKYQFNATVALKKYVKVPASNNRALANAVAKGPVSVAVDASTHFFQFYLNGVLDSEECMFRLNHGVLIVGYGMDANSGLDYWLVKNSWGPQWGDKGYLKIKRDHIKSDGICGIAMDASFPIID